MRERCPIGAPANSPMGELASQIQLEWMGSLMPQMRAFNHRAAAELTLSRVPSLESEMGPSVCLWLMRRTANRPSLVAGFLSVPTLALFTRSMPQRAASTGHFKPMVRCVLPLASGA